MNVRNLPLLLLLFISTSFINDISAQLLLKLQLIDDQKWGVFVKPVGVSPDSTTITGSGQVTVVMPEGYAWHGLESISGLWSAVDGTVDYPVENPGASYVTFGLLNAEPNYPINYTAGVETLLFSFEGDGSCPAFMYLIDCGTPNQSDPFCPPNSMNSNPSNDLSVIDFSSPIVYYNFSDVYAPYAWDCHDNDNDGLLNALEDTNGNGIFDAGDVSDLNHPNIINPPGPPKTGIAANDLPALSLVGGQGGQNNQNPFETNFHSDKTNQALTITLSPNPAREVIFVSFEKEILLPNAMLYLMDFQGRVLQQKNSGEISRLELDISTLPAGMYFVAIEVAGLFTERKKFVKQ